jgi:beta-mannosidase
LWQELGGFEAWAGEKDSFLMPANIEKIRGPSANLEELVEKSQFLQSEGLLNAFEEMRRQAPRCSMALNWCFNEPSLRAANLSVVSWPHEPKPALAAMTAAFRPILSSARIEKIDWKAGKEFECELWLLNDSGTAAPAVRVVAELETSAGTVPLLGWDSPAGVARRNIRGPTARGIIPAAATGLATLRLRVPGHPEWDSTYRLILR